MVPSKNFTILCVLLLTFDWKTMADGEDRVPYIRSPLARNLYSKMLMDERLRNMDLKELYTVHHLHQLPETVRARFVQLVPDEDTQTFLATCWDLNDRLLLQVFQEIARTFLGFFLQQTSINGILNRGRMFVWSKSQASLLLSDREGVKASQERNDVDDDLLDLQTFHDAPEAVHSPGLQMSTALGETTAAVQAMSLRSMDDGSEVMTSSGIHGNLYEGVSGAETSSSLSGNPQGGFSPSGTLPPSSPSSTHGVKSPGIGFPDHRGGSGQAFDVRLTDPSAPCSLLPLEDPILQGPSVGSSSGFSLSNPESKNCREVGTSPVGSSEEQGEGGLSPMGSLEEQGNMGLSPLGSLEEQGKVGLSPLGSSEEQSKVGRSPLGSSEEQGGVGSSPSCFWNPESKDQASESDCARIILDEEDKSALLGVSASGREINEPGLGTNTLLDSAQVAVPWQDGHVPWQDGHVLDVGAGDGHVTRILAEGAATVTATEISAVMRGRLGQKGYRVLDAHSWPENDSATYDFITCLNVLDRHVAPRQLVQAMRHKLKHDGRLVIALVLPFKPYVEYESSTHQPSEALGITGNTFEEQVTSLVETILPSMGFKVQSWTKLPYYCEGDLEQTFYWLEDVVVVAKKSSEPFLR